MVKMVTKSKKFPLLVPLNPLSPPDRTALCLPPYGEAGRYRVRAGCRARAAQRTGGGREGGTPAEQPKAPAENLCETNLSRAVGRARGRYGLTSYIIESKKTLVFPPRLAHLNAPYHD